MSSGRFGWAAGAGGEASWFHPAADANTDLNNNTPYPYQSFAGKRRGHNEILAIPPIATRHVVEFRIDGSVP